MLEHKISEGLSATFKKELSFSASPVAEELSYLLTTPQIVEVVIEASAKLLDPLVPSGYITIGKYLEISHDQPTLVLEGGPVTVNLFVMKIENNKIILDVKCYDDIGLIAKGKYERAIVDVEKLRAATYKRAESIL
ncbi:MAG: thioesterase family protein [Anaerovoracaceae bacterium]|jgi:fluoroacetyl-CoA thioesterase